jgi:hypothetical protein
MGTSMTKPPGCERGGHLEGGRGLWNTGIAREGGDAGHIIYKTQYRRGSTEAGAQYEQWGRAKGMASKRMLASLAMLDDKLP